MDAKVEKEGGKDERHWGFCGGVGGMGGMDGCLGLGFLGNSVGYSLDPPCVGIGNMSHTRKGAIDPSFGRIEIHIESVISGTMAHFGFRVYLSW